MNQKTANDVDEQGLDQESHVPKGVPTFIYLVCTERVHLADSVDESGASEML